LPTSPAVSDSAALADRAVAALEDMKAHHIVKLDVRALTGMTDFMVIASGTSSRHVKSLADSVEETLREAGRKSLGMEGGDVAEWVLVDFGDVLVHVMQPKIREFYNLEHLWGAAGGAAELPRPAQH
jgi:ribosome-associated protein